MRCLARVMRRVMVASGTRNALATSASTSLAWSVQPVAAGTVSHMMPGEFSLWAGGSNGTLYQLSLANGATEKTFVVGDGTRSARERAYAAADVIAFDGRQLRRDIAA